jgi:hypothetical protein
MRKKISEKSVFGIDNVDMVTIMLNMIALAGKSFYNENGPLGCVFLCLPEQRGLTDLTF